MKVLCIKTGIWARAITKEIAPIGPEFGETCTVIGTKPWSGGDIYQLLEYPDRWGWLAKWFIPVSNIDEREFERDYQKEKVLVYDRDRIS